MSTSAAIASGLMKYRNTQDQTWSKETAAFAETHDILVLAVDMGGLAGMLPGGELVDIG
jgi:hypothetical protein